MRLLHYSTEPIDNFDYTRAYKNGAGYMKPPGFWVSVEGPDDWYAWCRTESFGPKDPFVYEITLGPDTLAKLDAFHHDWAEAQPHFSLPIPRWADIRQDWDGIIIAPYRWARRLERDFMWYYGWDCASGVIWNLTAIKSVAPPTAALMVRKEPAE